MAKQGKCPFCNKNYDLYDGPTEEKQGTVVCPQHGRNAVGDKNEGDKLREEQAGDPEAEGVAARGHVATASGGGPSEEQTKAGPAVTDTLEKKSDGGGKVTH